MEVPITHVWFYDKHRHVTIKQAVYYEMWFIICGTAEGTTFTYQNLKQQFSLESNQTDYPRIFAQMSLNPSQIDKSYNTCRKPSNTFQEVTEGVKLEIPIPQLGVFLERRAYRSPGMLVVIWGQAMPFDISSNSYHRQAPSLGLLMWIRRKARMRWMNAFGSVGLRNLRRPIAW